MKVHEAAQPGDIVVIRIPHETEPYDVHMQPSRWHEWGVHKVAKTNEYGEVVWYENMCNGEIYAVPEAVDHMLVLSQDRVFVETIEDSMRGRAGHLYPYMDSLSKVKKWLAHFRRPNY